MVKINYTNECTINLHDCPLYKRGVGGGLEVFDFMANPNFSLLSFSVFSTINRYIFIRNPKSMKDSVCPC